jgi:hypothetical protein
VKRTDFFKGMWLSPLALLRGPERPLRSSSMFDAQTDTAPPEMPQTTSEASNVKSFGAIGDGTTDDTAAIRAAIAAATHDVPPSMVPLSMLDPEPWVVPGVGAS